MLENVKNGDIIICKSGYTFTWYNHVINDGMIYSFKNPDCYAECSVEVVKEIKNINKTLEFLKQQTGEEFEYHYGKIKCGEISVYDVVLKESFVTNKNKIKLIVDDTLYLCNWETMEPSVFIDKIAKGEWL